MIGRWAAAAAVLGGTAWVLKVGVILATGDEPPVAFAVGLVLFPFALLGLRSTLGRAGKRAARVGDLQLEILDRRHELTPGGRLLIRAA